MTTAADAPTKKPWYKKIWIWIIIGALVIIGAIANLVNPSSGNEAAPATTPPPVAETSEPSVAPDPVDTPEPITTAPSSEELEQSLKTALGVDQFSDLLAVDSSLWGGYVAGVRVEHGNAYVTLQIASDDPSRDDTGERAAKAISTLLPAADVEGISWIIVEDASGAVIAQEQPRPLS